LGTLKYTNTLQSKYRVYNVGLSEKDVKEIEKAKLCSRELETLSRKKNARKVTERRFRQERERMKFTKSHLCEHVFA